MNLDVHERMALIDLLSPQAGKYEDLHTLRRVKGMIGFNDQELERLNVRLENGAYVWDERAASEMVKPLHFDEWAQDYIAGALEGLSEAGNLPAAYMGLYEKFVFYDPSDKLPMLDPDTEARLNELRKGKRTVALVGMSPASCSLAPFQNSEVELWGCNESHAFKFFTRATRWFQVHTSYKQKVAKRGVRGHYDWLRTNPWDIPIYTNLTAKDIKGGVVYPLAEVCELLEPVRRGEARIKYFNSSFDYMLGLALLEKFERIEVYGFDMAGDNEYQKQKPSAEFWLGVAIGRGVEVWLPPDCMLLKSELYGGNEQGEGW